MKDEATTWQFNPGVLCVQSSREGNGRSTVILIP